MSKFEELLDTEVEHHSNSPKWHLASFVSPHVLVKPSEAVLEFESLAQLLRDDWGGGEAIAEEEDEEKAAERSLVPVGSGMVHQLVQEVRLVQLPEVPNEQEGQEKAQPFVHPRLKAVNSDVHVMALSQGFEAVKTPSLVHELKVLNEANVDIKCHELSSETLVALTHWPN